MADSPSSLYITGGSAVVVAFSESLSWQDDDVIVVFNPPTSWVRWSDDDSTCIDELKCAVSKAAKDWYHWQFPYTYPGDLADWIKERVETTTNIPMDYVHAYIKNMWADYDSYTQCSDRFDEICHDIYVYVRGRRFLRDGEDFDEYLPISRRR